MSAPSVQTISRDDHYLPQFYLRRWAVDGRLWVYRTLVSHDSVPKWRAHSVKGVAYHQHLYSQTAHGVETDAVERWLAENVDAPSQEVIEKVVSSDRLTPKDWDVLFRFFAASQARTPANFVRRQPVWNRDIPALINDVLKDTVAELTEQKGTIRPQQPAYAPMYPGVDVPSRVRVRDAGDGKNSVIEAEVLAGRKLWLFEIRRMVEHTWKGLRQLRWTILRPPEGVLWLTSDDPATVARIYPNGHVMFNGGWVEPGSVLVLPLDPRHVLYARKGPVPLKYSEASAFETDFIQNCIARHSHRLVFGREKNDWVPTVRPRQVDPDSFEHERNEWRRWHPTQSDAEAGLEDASTWHVPDGTES